MRGSIYVEYVGTVRAGAISRVEYFKLHSSISGSTFNAGSDALNLNNTTKAKLQNKRSITWKMYETINACLMNVSVIHVVALLSCKKRSHLKVKYVWLKIEFSGNSQYR